MNPEKALAGIAVLFFFLLVTRPVKAQEYFLYETNTLAEGSINPETEVFYGSKCKRFAFNFFVPQVHFSAIAYGPAGKFLYDSYLFDKLKKGVFNAQPDKTDYLIGDTRLDLLNIKFMLNRFTRSELLIDYQLRATGDADFRNGLFSLSAISQSIDNGNQQEIRQFDNYANTNSYYLAFSQLSAGYRMNFDKDLSAGFMLGLLGGIAASTLDISNSKLNYPVTQPGQPQILKVSGSGYLLSSQKNENDQIGPQFNAINDYLPNFRNPGLNFSAGLRYRLNENSAISGNIKDLGFIVWRKAFEYDLNPETDININSFNLSSELKSHFKTFFTNSHSRNWAQVLPAKVEASYSNCFYTCLRSSIVLSKPLFSADGYLSVLNDLHYKCFHFIINTGYDSRGAADVGLHLLYQTSAVEFFVGSERLNGLSQLPSQLDKFGQANKRISADVNMGFALKFGSCFYVQNATDMHLDGRRPGFFERLFN